MEQDLERRRPPGPLPARVLLRPGAGVLVREAGRLQVGLGRGTVVVAATPVVADWLGALGAGAVRVPDSGEAHAVAVRLWGAGLLVDADAWDADRSARPRLAAAAYARDVAEAHESLTRRAAGRIGLLVDPPWRAELDALLVANGLAVTDVKGPDADVQLVASAREHDRGVVDGLLRGGQPHLVVRETPAEIVVGPLVVPGRTACLRCLDAHRTDQDPRWPLLLHQLVSAIPSCERPAEPALRTLALAWAVRDLATYLEGGRPATWSATVTVDATLALPRRAWLRHPHCGCAWGELRDAG